jgi:hypothetical protein
VRARIVYENHYRNQTDPSVHSEGFFVFYLHFSGVEIYYLCRRKTNKLKQEDVSNNSKEKEPYEGSFSVIGTCGEVSVCPDLSLPERE